ncbi:MAG: hypothetical protein HY887_09215 [Deltaproteobacteria bacterium]|nr:hypothetical protein [Deltaproteobacteria bacterium]
MGIYTEYLNKGFDLESLTQERKKQLLRISELRGRAVLTFASALAKQAPVAIEYDDRIPIFDHLIDLVRVQICNLNPFIRIRWGVRFTNEQVVQVANLNPQ